jgi:hypothetical protein
MKDHSGRGAKAALLACVLSLALGAGTAYAYWTHAGAGSGSAEAAAMQTVTVDAFVSGDSPQSTLIPGGTADVILRVNNPNSYPVQAYSVAATGPATADAAHPGCTTTGVTFTGAGGPLTPAVTLAANSSTLITLPGAAAMNITSQSACQGATFHLPATLEARK